MNTQANKNNPSFDVVVVGAGLVGSSLALALKHANLRVAVIESKPISPRRDPLAQQDERSLVLAHATVQALMGWDVLPKEANPASLLQRVHASSERDFGAVRFEAHDMGLPYLGRTVPASELSDALNTAMQHTQATVFLPASITDMQPSANGWSLSMSSDDEAVPKQLSTKLLVAADGTHSHTRTRLGIGVTHHDYQQTLFVANAKFSQSPPNQAWMRFTPNGPTALLPRADGWMGTVSTAPEDQAEAVAQMSDSAYADFLQQRVGYRLGRIQSLGKRTHYPLHLYQAKQTIAHRAVLVGNAAQSLNPIGAQGFNLGIRDAVTLAQVIQQVLVNGDDMGDAAWLRRYEERRSSDRQQTIRATDALSKVFMRPEHGMSLLRSAGFSALSLLPPVREHIAMQATGWQAWPRNGQSNQMTEGARHGS